MTNYSRVPLEQARLSLSHAINKHQLGHYVSSDVLIDHAANQMVMQLTATMARTTKEVGEPVEVRIPDGWFQALKEQHFPSWYTRRYPVRYRTVTVDTKIVSHRYCTHLPLPANGRPGCIEFLCEDHR